MSPSIRQTVSPQTNSPTVFVNQLSSKAQPSPKASLQREVLRISSVDKLNYFNVDYQLTLSGTIYSYHQCSANWTIRNSSVNLGYSSLVSGSKLVLPWQWSTVSLVLKPSTLGSSSLAFRFDLRCGYLNSSVLVIPNMPPRGGSFSVTPSMGYEVQTPFIFEAIKWIDKDIPLGYQFTYTTTQRSQLRIGVSYPYCNSTTSLLPAGSATARYSMNCSVRVYDAYGAASMTTSSVTVRPVSSQVAQAFVLSTINTSSSGISLSVINLLGSLLSKVNCSGSPNCATLYRSPCSSVDHTCGSCFSGYAGESGSRNSPCVNLRSFSVRNSSSSCSVTKAELEQKQKIRGVLLNSLLNLTQHSLSAAAVTALASSLFTQTANPDEISVSAASSVLGIANSLLSTARQFKVDQQDISSQLLPSIDAVATAWNPAEQSPNKILDTLQNLVLFSSSQMHPSQDSIANVLSNFKTSVNALSTTTITVPLSPLELLAGEKSSQVDLSGLLSDDFTVIQSTRVSLVQLQSSFYSKNSSFKSNPLVITHSVPIANLTVCNCSLSKGLANKHRRLDSSSGDTVVTTTLQVVATGRYVVEQVGETLAASPSLASSDTIEHVVVVISMFASLWVIGFALVAVGRWTRGNKIKVRVEGEPIQRASAPLTIHHELTAYIEEVIPSIFRGESDTLKTIREVFRRHKYAALVYTSNLTVLNVSRIVTVQSMLMFILAVSYDLQSPSDDGSCVNWQTEASCVERKSYLDSTQTYCQWELTSADGMGSSFSGYACSYRVPYPTPQEVLSITVIVSVLTAFFLRPMEFFFKILSAPISNRDRIPFSKRTGRGKGTEDSSFAELLRNHHISKMAGIQVRGIPETTITTRSIARKSLRGLTKIPPPHEGRLPLAKRENWNRLDRGAIAHQFILTEAYFSKDAVKANLAIAINRQRCVLSGMELDEFDSQWGILRHSETILARSQSSDLSDLLFIAGMFDRIYLDVESVRNSALAKIEALRVTTEEQTGLEVFQLFIADLLGRDSPAAKIFRSKLGEDFEQTKVVKYNKKVFAGAVLVTLNILFCYYSILYGSVRGEAWQMIYLGACLAQFFIEICINETLECLWLHYIVPQLAATEVIAAHRVLVDLVDTFCRCQGADTDTQPLIRSPLNAPDYLFVSTNVARAFPSLMESLIIQSYRTPLPGESAKQWHMSRWQRFLSHLQTPRRGNIFLRLSATASTTAWALLEYGATAPFLLQKMFVRFCQPFLVSGIVLAFYLVIESPLYITLFFLSAMVAISYANRRRLAKLAARRLMAVTPLPSSSPVNTNMDGVFAQENRSIRFSISSEPVVSAASSSFPSPLNSSEEGSYYSSIPDSSVGNYDNIEADHYEPVDEMFYLSVNDGEDNDDSCGSGDNSSDDDEISIHIPSSVTFVGY
eukprot:gene26337-biopygen21943